MPAPTHIIPLTKGAATFVSPEDFAAMLRHHWSLDTGGYAVAKIRGLKHPMHRILMRPKARQQVDHINGDKLDNRRENLRLCTHAQNNMNRGVFPHTSTYKGVSWERARSKWRATIRVNGKNVNLGRFDREIDAALAYDRAAKKYFGKFARLNFPRAA